GVVVVPFRQDLSSCESAADRAAAAMQQEEVLRMMYERKCGECGKTAVCPLYDRARSAYEKHNDKTQWN
ncbi:hypothetical protein KY359_03990, partial [Candidatus Woesearchaeota archaeon]|nr:hypothetical protein [Candidatus Woesearchaeota archaeon]